MANSTLIADYVGQGLASARPAAPPTATDTLSFYYATDTTTLSYYDWNTTAWVDVGTSSAEWVYGDTFRPITQTTSGSGNAFKGVCYIPNRNTEISHIAAMLTSVNTATYKAVVLELNGLNVIQAVNSSANIVATDSVFQQYAFRFATPVALTAGTRYALMVGRTDSTNTYVLPCAVSTSNYKLNLPGTHVSDIQGAAVLPQATPAVSQTVTLGSGAFAMSIRANINAA